MVLCALRLGPKYRWSNRHLRKLQGPVALKRAEGVSGTWHRGAAVGNIPIAATGIHCIGDTIGRIRGPLPDPIFALTAVVLETTVEVNELVEVVLAFLSLEVQEIV